GNGYIALGVNGWQVSLTVQSSPTPNFRVLSTGRTALNGQPVICLGPGSSDWVTAHGGYFPLSNTRTPVSGGDNTFYWLMIAFLKRQTVTPSGFVDLYTPPRVPPGFEDSRLGPYFTNPQTGAIELPPDTLPHFTWDIDPPLGSLPGGTQVVAQFRAAGAVDTLPWYWSEWANPGIPAPGNATANVGGVVLYPQQIRAQLRPDAVNFPLDPSK